MNYNELWDIEDEMMQDINPTRTSRKSKVRVTVTQDGRSLRRLRKIKTLNTTQTEKVDIYD